MGNGTNPDQPTRMRMMVSVDDEGFRNLSEIVEACKAAGLEVDSVLDAAGVITGQGDRAVCESVKHIKGVAAVEEQREVQIAPPTDTVQ